jgi:ABC-type Na+ transport system ATPase subunit NatA
LLIVVVVSAAHKMSAVSTMHDGIIILQRGMYVY